MMQKSSLVMQVYVMSNECWYSIFTLYSWTVISSLISLKDTESLATVSEMWKDTCILLGNEDDHMFVIEIFQQVPDIMT